MSNLRDRLKRISSERMLNNSSCPDQTNIRCSKRTSFVNVPLQEYLPDILTLLGGNEFEGLLIRPEEWIFIDTETNGLSGGAGTIAFEIGIGEITGKQMRITQLWIQDYDREEDMLRELNDMFEHKKAIVSFNGKSFDLPMLEKRCILNRIHPRWNALPHLDLLHAARRIYKLRIGKCSLEALEETVLGKSREADIPGKEIPSIWREYLETKNVEKLMKVFDHNLLDVQNMAYLLYEIYQAHKTPAKLPHEEDVFSVGKVYDRKGRTNIAEKCYLSVSGSQYRGLAGHALTRIYRREKRTEELIALLQDMIHSGSGDLFLYVELAKIYEHKLGQPEKALYYTDKALAQASDLQAVSELIKRRTRLAARIHRRERS